MPLPWRAALCAAPTILVLAGSAYLGDRSRGERARPPADDRTPGEIMIATTADDEDRIHRVALKYEATVDLLEGRMTFDEAVARFWEVTSGSPESLTFLHEATDGTTDEERIIHQVVAFARVQAAKDPQRYRAIFERLEREAASRICDLRVH